MLLKPLLLTLTLILSVACHASKLVLFPLDITPDLPTNLNDAAVFGSALQEGLQKRYQTIYYGPAVEDRLTLEFSKENCTAEECIENTLINFDTTSYIEANVTVEPKGYIIVIKHFDLLNPDAFRTQTSACDPCSKKQFIQHLKHLGAAKSNHNTSEVAIPAAPSSHRTQWIFYTLGTKGIESTEDLVNDEQVSLGLEWRIYPQDKALGFSISPFLSATRHDADALGIATNAHAGLRTMIHIKSFLSLGLQAAQQFQSTQFKQVENNNLFFSEGIIGLHYQGSDIQVNLFYNRRLTEHTVFNKQAYAFGLGYVF